MSNAECKAKNGGRCTCTHDPCSRKGICCECVAYHRMNGEVPGCFFSPKGERTYDRTIAAFIADQKGR
ncbi:MAG: hypothetical protein GX442_26340 [Candidatus Riflebacteria bacterium]|nr:hypothetical protein [Candidatus Riflebacteria bacterium]